MKKFLIYAFLYCGIYAISLGANRVTSDQSNWSWAGFVYLVMGAFLISGFVDSLEDE